MEFDNGEVVDMRNVSTSLSNAMELARDLQMPVQMGLENPFVRTYPKRITGKVDMSRSLDVSILRAATTDKTIYKPGETAKIFVESRTWQGPDKSEVFELPIPAALRDGPCQIVLSDAQRFVSDEMRFAPYKFQATDIGGTFGMLRSIAEAKSDTLFVRLTTRGEGLAVGRAALPNLPTLKRDVLMHEARSEVVVYANSIVTKHPMKHPVMGSIELTIVVAQYPDRQPNVPAAPPGGPMPIPVPPSPSPHGVQPVD
jgi:hypothetical protein